MIKVDITVFGDKEKIEQLTDIEMIQIKVLRNQTLNCVPVKGATLEQRILFSKIELEKICQALKNGCENNSFFSFNEKSMTIFIKKPFEEPEATLNIRSPYQILYHLLVKTVCSSKNCVHCLFYNIETAGSTCLLTSLQKRMAGKGGKNMW